MIDRSPTRPPDRGEHNPWVVLIVICTAVFMLLLDTTIVNNAQVKIRQGLNADLTEIQWVLDSYILAYAVLFAWTRFPKLGTRGRLMRLVITVPLLASCIPLAQYDRYSWVRDRLSILPMMWDQNANYRHNGFLIALAFNLPML